MTILTGQANRPTPPDAETDPMADAVNQSTLKQVLLPASAAALIVLLIGVLILQSDFAPSPDGPVVKSNVPTGPSGKSDDRTVAGMSATLPAIDAPEWQNLGEGVKFWDVKEGEGLGCPPGAKVTMHYTGWTLSGNKFDSSVDRGVPNEFSLGSLIVGWQRGIPGMKAGGIRRLYIPAKLGYGETGSPPKIPPQADLVFEVKLVAFGS